MGIKFITVSQSFVELSNYLKELLIQMIISQNIKCFLLKTCIRNQVLAVTPALNIG